MPLYLIDTVTLPDNASLRALTVGVWPADSPQRGSWEGLCMVGPGPALAALLSAMETGAPRGELAEMMRRDGYPTIAADSRS